MVAKTHTDDPFWKFRDQPQEKVAISACCWPRNPSDIAERLYRRRRTATLLFILLKTFYHNFFISMYPRFMNRFLQIRYLYVKPLRTFCLQHKKSNYWKYLYKVP